MQEIAERAGVSKALIHYHFRDRDTLLIRLTEVSTRAIVARQRAALGAATSHRAVEQVWSWVADELRRGQLRVLIDLAHEPRAPIRTAVVASLGERRAATAAMVERLFALLELRPRIPAPLIAETFLAWLDGLVAHAALRPDGNHRVSFDVLWLSFLSLAE